MRVVICFHFTIFVVLETTCTDGIQRSYPLWFAFILLSLSYWKQLTIANTTSRGVVICFHFTIFVVLETTYTHRLVLLALLWFAFILLSLSYWKQLKRAFFRDKAVVICFHFTIFVVLETTDERRLHPAPRCDLLSFYYLCRTGNNIDDKRREWKRVVICFHFTIFVVLETTPCWKQPSPTWLWFAFILLSLSYWKQPGQEGVHLRRRCDLLSFYYLCRTGNNAIAVKVTRNVVVICFHFTIFVVLETTNRYADKLEEGCDLLSFYYLCRTGNNITHAIHNTIHVVICFHFTIFVVLETTLANRTELYA